MSSSSNQETKLDNIENLDIDGWEVVSREEEIELMSENKKHKITIQTVQLQNDKVPVGFQIEFHEGDEPYARYRDTVDSIIAPDSEMVKENILQLIEQNT